MREITKLSLRLMIFALISALMLAVVNALTEDRISDIERAKVNGARIQVLGDYDFEEVPADLTGFQYIKHIYVGTDKGEVKGYVYELESTGFAGAISFSLGIDASGTVTGIAIANHTETKGLGTDQEAPFLNQFIGLSAANAGTARPETPAATATAEAETGASPTGTPEAVTGASPTTATIAEAETGASATATPEAVTEASPATAEAETGASATATPEAVTGASVTATPGANTDANTGATTEGTDGTTGATTDGTTGATTETELSGAAASGAVAEVDGMTGATYSTNAIKNAVAEALSHFSANYLGGGAAQ